MKINRTPYYEIINREGEVEKLYEKDIRALQKRVLEQNIFDSDYLLLDAIFSAMAKGLNSAV